MRNYVQAGNTITAIAPAGGVSSGSGVLYGSLFGVAAMNAAEGAEVEIVTQGVFDLAKATATTFSGGARVSWDAENGQCVAPGPGAYPIGVVMQAAGNGGSTAHVRLDGISTAAAA
jgi:predicted RecA/RadA family phage recombinase